MPKGFTAASASSRMPCPPDPECPFSGANPCKSPAVNYNCTLFLDLSEETRCQTRLSIEWTVEGQGLKFNETDSTSDKRDAELDVLIAEYETPLLRYATRIVNDADAARDVVQQAFLKLVAVWKAKDYAHISNPKSWLYRVTHNLAVDHVRRETRLRTLHEKQTGDPALSHASTRHMDCADKHREVLRHLDVLTPLEKQVPLLRLEEEFSYKEIARITRRGGGRGCSARAANARNARDRNTLARACTAGPVYRRSRRKYAV